MDVATQHRKKKEKKTVKAAAAGKTKGKARGRSGGGVSTAAGKGGKRRARQRSNDNGSSSSSSSSSKLAWAGQLGQFTIPSEVGGGGSNVLPEGWWVETKVRQVGKTAGQTDKYYISPDGKKRCRSMPEVHRHISRTSTSR